MDAIDRIRAFSRLFTSRLGLLDRSYLDSGLTMTEVRVLYELAHHPGLTARTLAQTLEVDEGYLSRLLKRFREQGWLVRRADPADRRARTLELAPEGMARFRPLEEASRREIAEATERLGGAGREALAGALDRAGRLMSGSEVELRDLRPGDPGWIIGQHGALYARDEGYDATFEALVAEILAAFLKDHDPARERGWIAEAGGERLGTIFCVRHTDEIAKLRLFLLLPEARGLGLGQRLHDACTRFARDAGYSGMTLWTHESHRAACALYARNGWRKVSETPVHAFGQDVVDQEWELTF
jgi:DNA-binding MarR family transcriptional regulator/predicted N-acetyltransferase YhbS